MKLIATLALATLAFSHASAFAAPVAGVYGLHLFFNEKEFVDVLTIRETESGALEGTMEVPDDFQGTLLAISAEGDRLAFDLPVPKNSSRPEDLVFHYEGKFFSDTKEQLTGFVTLKGEKGFVASFVAFRRN